MRRIGIALCLAIAFSQPGQAADLYKVNLYSQKDAETLRNLNVEPLVWVDGGYLVLADEAASERLGSSRLQALLMATDVSKDRLAFDGRMDNLNAARYRVLYQAEGIRLLQVEKTLSVSDRAAESLFPVRNEHLTIEYRVPLGIDAGLKADLPTDDILDSLVAEINQDSLYNYVWALQEYPYRVTGTDANLGARVWIYNKFIEFGYTNAFVDPFFAGVECANVIAFKTGTVYPERIIIVGGHFDSVERSPGADDNASGTAATLEIARALSGIESPVTIIFVAFDAEETGLDGANDLRDSALAEGWDILFVMNMDMIGALGNVDSARTYAGAEQAFAILWSSLADEYEGLKTVRMGSSAGSDHFPFQQAGYDVIFSHEHFFSDVYHTERDSTTHMNFAYMTRMVRGSLATVYTVSQIPRPVAVTDLVQVGDGQSLQMSWLPTECIGLAEYRVGYMETYDPLAMIQYVAVPITDTTYTVSGLTEGIDYTVFVQAIDDQGKESLPFYGTAHAAPQSRPEMPAGLMAMPGKEAIILTWVGNNTELDFDHYEIIRDGEEIIGQTLDTTYTDSYPSLGTDYHAYHAVAVDSDGNASDTLGLDPAVSRAGLLDPNRILAINRSSCYNVDFVSAYETGVFLQAALEGYDYDFYSDTTAVIDPYAFPQLDLVDMIDYGVLVVGAETGIYDDIGVSPSFNGILDTLAYYVSIGGKLVVFGRWGTVLDVADTIDYLTDPYPFNNAYRTTFDIDRRIFTPTVMVLSDVQADLVGAHSLAQGYPDLVWDSSRTLLHSTAQNWTVTSVGGIPCESFVRLVEGAATPIYAYDSRGDSPLSEGQTVAWKHIGEDYGYVWFDIPLSHFNRPAAILALRQAVDEVSGAGSFVEEEPGLRELPQTFTLHQNYPNPFNPNTDIVYSLPRRDHVMLSIFNVLGQRVRKLVDRIQAAGTYTVGWDGTGDDGSRLATGIYLYRMQAGDVTLTKKMLLLK